jgi:hypothetical protein
VDPYEPFDVAWFGGARCVRADRTRECPARGSTADASFLVVNARVFDGERLLERTDVAVEGGIIRAVGRGLTG